MKKYIICLINIIRLLFIKIFKCRYILFDKVELLSLNTKIVVKKNSHITLGTKVISDGRTIIDVDNHAKLCIGKQTYFNEGAIISVKSSVTIGHGCLFGPNVKIYDNNHKFTRAEGVKTELSTGHIEIGCKTWIGANCVILKNTHIGKHCVIGAGCIISGSIPDYSIVTQSRELKIVEIKE